MSFNHTLSAVLRGLWLLEPTWGRQHSPLAVKLVRGEQLNLGTILDSKDDVNPIHLTTYGYKVGRYTDLGRLPQGSIAIVDLIGPVTRYGGSCSYGLEDKANLLRDLANSPNIAAIVLNVNSPGGEASGTESFTALIKSITKIKPVIGFVEDGMAASAAMWIISACTEVYASNLLSSFGSIGAFTVLIDETKALEAENIIVREIYAPQSVDKNKDYRDAIAGDTSAMEARLGVLVDHFIADVTANRKGKLNLSAGNPFTGKMYNTKDAMAIGLADGIKSMEEVIARASELAQKKKSTQTTNPNMKGNKYTRLAAAAGWDAGYEAPEDGLHMNHDDAGKVEASLEQGSKDAATVAANATALQDKDKQISELTSQLDASKKETEKQRALAEKYGAQAADETTTIVDKDAATEQSAKTFGNDSTTKEAMQLFNGFRKKK